MQLSSSETASLTESTPYLSREPSLLPRNKPKFFTFMSDTATDTVDFRTMQVEDTSFIGWMPNESSTPIPFDTPRTEASALSLEKIDQYDLKPIIF